MASVDVGQVHLQDTDDSVNVYTIEDREVVIHGGGLITVNDEYGDEVLRVHAHVPH